MTFGEFITLEDLYYSEYGKKPKYRYPIRLLRNAAAHSNCLIYNLNKKVKKPNKSVNSAINQHMRNKGKELSKTERDCLETMFVHDFTALLYVFFSTVESQNTLSRAKENITKVLEQLIGCLPIFTKHIVIKNNLEFLVKICKSFI